MTAHRVARPGAITPRGRPPDRLPPGPTARARGRSATVVVAALDLLLLATWLPHYLTWPWWADTDAFATIALAWDDGRRPFRDVIAFNFPGPIYLSWVLGRAFGWGRTAPLYAVDAAALVALGVALAGWSRRRLGRALPGLIGYAAVLSYYLGQDYTQVAQRDWHGPLLAVLGLLAAQSWPGRLGRLAAAAALAAGAAFRPHVVLFVPASALAVADGLPRPWSWRRGRDAALEWSLAVAAGLALALAPLALAGVAGDFLRGLGRVGLGARYARGTWSDAAALLAGQVREPRVAASLAALGLASLVPAGPDGRATRRAARVWLTALLGALLYKPIHPVPHDYLDHPLHLVVSVGLSVPAAWALGAAGPAAAPRLLLCLAALAAAVPGIPAYCSPTRSLDAPRDLARGHEPVRPPLGYARRPSLPNAAHYEWADYRATLAYLRRTTAPGTRVANVLKGFPAINGPVGRPSPFAAESGLVWAWLEGPAVEARLAQELERSVNSVVVWVPGESGPVELSLVRLTATIRRRYRPEARFGAIEVWRRRDAGRRGPKPNTRATRGKVASPQL